MHTRDLATKQTLYKSSRGSYVPAEMKTKKLQHTKSMGDIPSAMKAELDLPRTDIPPAHANARSRQVCTKCYHGGSMIPLFFF